MARKRYMNIIFLLLLVFKSILFESAEARDSVASIRIVDFIDRDISGTECFNIIYNLHVKAIREGTSVDYSGIDSLNITIPSNAKSIPIDGSIDFRGVKINVKNREMDMFLFEMVGNSLYIDITYDDLSKLILGSNHEWTKDEYAIVIIED